MNKLEEPAEPESRLSPPTRRVVAVVELLASRPDGAGRRFADICRDLGISRSTGTQSCTRCALAGGRFATRTVGDIRWAPPPPGFGGKPRRSASCVTTTTMRSSNRHADVYVRGRGGLHRRARRGCCGLAAAGARRAATAVHRSFGREFVAWLAPTRPPGLMRKDQLTMYSAPESAEYSLRFATADTASSASAILLRVHRTTGPRRWRAARPDLGGWLLRSPT